MSQRKKNGVSKSKNESTERARRPKVTTLEEFSSEIFFTIFDYLRADQIYTSFYGLNRHINQLIHNTPNVHLDLTRTTRKFYQSFRQIFSETNLVSVVLSIEHINSIQQLLSVSGGKRLKSVCLNDLSLYASEMQLAKVLNYVKDQVVSVKINFDSMQSGGGGNCIRESFAYLLTELPSLKSLALSNFHEYFYMNNMDPIISNNHVTCLALSVFDYEDWMPLLHRLPKLRSLTIHFIFRNEKKRAAPRDSTSYFGCQVQGHVSLNQPCLLRHVCIYGFNMILENFENLLRLFVTQNLLTLKLFDCKRAVTGFPLPKRRPPFLDGTKWHDLTNKYFQSTMKQFHVEFVDVDNIMSMTNIAQIEKALIEHHGSDRPCQVTCSYDPCRKYLAFDFNYS